MAYTEQEKDKWLEIAQDTGSNLEDTNSVPVLRLEELDTTVSIPGVKFTSITYDENGNATIDGKPESFAQLALGTLAIKTTAAQNAADNANQAAARAETAAEAAAGADNVNATLVGMTVTITDRQGVSRSVNIGFEITDDHVYASKNAMMQDAANVPAGTFCMIATSDKTAEDNATLWSRNTEPATAEEPYTFLSDLDQAATHVWDDWNTNLRQQVVDAIQAALDTADMVETQWQGADGTGGLKKDVQDATALANQKAGYAQTQGDYAKAWNEHPPYVADGTVGHPGDLYYMYLYDITTRHYVRGAYLKGADLDYSTMTHDEYERLVTNVRNSIVFATVETCESIIDEIS